MRSKKVSGTITDDERLRCISMYHCARWSSAISSSVARVNTRVCNCLCSPAQRSAWTQGGGSLYVDVILDLAPLDLEVTLGRWRRRGERGCVSERSGSGPGAKLRIYRTRPYTRVNEFMRAS